MKYFLLSCIFIASQALADNAKPIPLRQTPSNVQIINGKRFYSLSNARRFTGGLDSPRALSVIHHPRQLAPVNAANTRSLLPIAPTHGANGQPMAQTNSQKVLSVFAPEDRGSSLPATK